MSFTISKSDKQFTHHFQLRCEERNISNKAIRAVVKYGTCYRSYEHSLVYWLSTKAIANSRIAKLQKYLNTVIVIQNGRYITGYRSECVESYWIPIRKKGDRS